uniref:Uncharacterized protein n=1 Tax=Romanomermis culicivorax TaxID=13658 RepID=A0A915HW38_ROMCU
MRGVLKNLKPSFATGSDETDNSTTTVLQQNLSALSLPSSASTFGWKRMMSKIFKNAHIVGVSL